MSSENEKRAKELAINIRDVSDFEDFGRLYPILLEALTEAEARGRYEGETYIEELKLKSPSKTPGYWPTKKASAAELRKMYPEDSDGRKIELPSEETFMRWLATNKSPPSYETVYHWLRERVEGNK